MKRFGAEGALSTAASSAPGKKLRSKMVWTDRAPAVKIGLAGAIDAPAVGRDPSAYFKLEDGIQTMLSWGEGMQMRGFADGVAPQMLSRPFEPRLIFAGHPLKK
jgi:hypothetical protein